MLRVLGTPQLLLLLVVVGLLGAWSREGQTAVLDQRRQPSNGNYAGLMQATPPQEEEVARVQTHIDGAIELLENADVHELSPMQRERRNQSIAALRRYRDAGQFPKNIDFPEGLRPTFVDHEGTHCALAYLIAETGEHELVERVAATRNHAYVRELVDEPALVAWLQDSGISVDEAARIQPGYSVEAAGCLCPAVRPLVVADARSDGSDYAIIESLYGDATAAPSGARSRVPITTRELPRVLLIGTGDRTWESQPYPYVGNTIDCPTCLGYGISYCSIQGRLPKRFVIDALLSDDCQGFIRNNDPDGYVPKNLPLENPPTHDPRNWSGFVLAAICFTIVSALLVAFAIFFLRYRRRTVL